MKQSAIPLLTTTLGLIMVLLLVATGATAPRSEQALPLLTLLFMSDLGFLVTLGGAIYGIKLWQQQRAQRFLLVNAVAGIALALGLLVLGLTLWSTTTAAAA
jgi:hypothetical protein